MVRSIPLIGTDIAPDYLNLDEALLAAVEISRFKSPAVHTAKVVDYAVSKDHFNTLAHELGTDLLGHTDKSKLLAILTPPKSWFHKYIDTNERLRRLFAEVSTRQNPAVHLGETETIIFLITLFNRN